MLKLSSRRRERFGPSQSSLAVMARHFITRARRQNSWAATLPLPGRRARLPSSLRALEFLWFLTSVLRTWRREERARRSCLILTICFIATGVWGALHLTSAGLRTC